MAHQNHGPLATGSIHALQASVRLTDPLLTAHYDAGAFVVSGGQAVNGSDEAA